MNQNEVLKENKDHIVTSPVFKMKKKVFLSGPILGMEKQQDYRKTITEICEKIGVNIINPWLREKRLYKREKNVGGKKHLHQNLLKEI